MSDHKALAIVAREIDKLRQEQIMFLSTSRAETYDEYKKICGVIRGLNLAEDVINSLVHKMENDDE